MQHLGAALRAGVWEESYFQFDRCCICNMGPDEEGRRQDQACVGVLSCRKVHSSLEIVVR